MTNTIFANDVRQTLDHFRRSVDQMFENFYGYQERPAVAGGTSERNWTFSPLVESGWTDTHLNLRAILPGVQEKELKVSVQNNQLVIEGERRAPEGFDKNAYTQMAYGRFYSAMSLPAGLDLDHINCRLQNGVLDLQVPIAEASKPKQIRIQSSTPQKALSA